MRPILPPATLGVLGGGQLGAFFVAAAKQLGYRVAVLDPNPLAPAHRLADLPLVAPCDDPAALAGLARQCAAVTIEQEAVSAGSLQQLAQRCRVAPSAEALVIAQDRLRAKRFLRAIGLPTAPFVDVLSAGDVAPPAFFPAILKTARNGYDGRGQLHLPRASGLADAWRTLGRVPCVLEKKIAWDRELSLVLARGADGRMAVYPLAENRHRNGILELTRAPAEADPVVTARAVSAAARIAEALDYVGVMAVEFFLEGATLLVNEFAPRPHNSGHYTLDACEASQFEQQVRALCGLPLASTALRTPAAMANVLGDAWRAGDPPLEDLALRFDARLHCYGKSDARPGRKMGHFTVLDPDPARAAERAEALLRKLRTSPRTVAAVA